MKEITDLRKMHFEEEKNISQIQEKTGFDRKTIRNFVNKKRLERPGSNTYGKRAKARQVQAKD